MFLDRKISKAKNSLRGASDDMRALTVERRKAKAKGLRAPDAAGAVFAVRRCLEPEAPGVTSGTWTSSGSVLTRGFRLGARAQRAALEVRRRRGWQRYGWMARAQVHVRQTVQERRLCRSAKSQRHW